MVLENPGNGPSYIEFIFHPERRGMLDVVETIVSFMDYQRYSIFFVYLTTL